MPLLVDFLLIERLARACRRQGLQNYRVWGLWLPGSFAALLFVALLSLPALWLPACIGLLVLGTFSSFSRHKAKKLRARPARVLLVRVLDKQLLSRGHWRADGLVFPVEVEVHYCLELDLTREGSTFDAGTAAVGSVRAKVEPATTPQSFGCASSAAPRAIDAAAGDEADREASETLRMLAQRMRRCTPHMHWIWLEQGLIARVREGLGLLVVLLGDERACGIVVDERVLVVSHRFIDSELRDQVEVVGAK